jgi:hypothetical protein
MVGEVFIHHAENLKVYAIYCSTYNEALEILDSCNKKANVKEFWQNCESNPRCRNLPIESFLIKPIQVRDALLYSLIKASDEISTTCT